MTTDSIPAEDLRWPSAVPSIDEGREILARRASPPPLLTELTEKTIAALTPSERRALGGAGSSEEQELLCRLAAARWRLAAAILLRPKGEAAIDEKSLFELSGEAGDVLAAVGRVKESYEPELQKDRQDAVAAVRRILFELLSIAGASGAAPGSSAPAAAPEAAASPADGKQPSVAKLAGERARAAAFVAEQARAEAREQKDIQRSLSNATAEASPVAGPKEKFQLTPRRMLAIGAAVLSLALFGVTAAIVLIPESERPVPTLPAAPPGTVLFGDPRSGTVILSTRGGEPLEKTAAEKFKAEATAAGATVRALGPSQLLITAGPPADRR